MERWVFSCFVTKQLEVEYKYEYDLLHISGTVLAHCLYNCILNVTVVLACLDCPCAPCACINWA